MRKLGRGSISVETHTLEGRRIDEINPPIDSALYVVGAGENRFCPPTARFFLTPHAI